MANDGHQIAVPARLRSENTKAVLAIVKGNSLDKSREYFLSSGGRYFRQASSRCKATVWESLSPKISLASSTPRS
jgi:hypothetical protein